MQYYHLKNGVKVPKLGFGTWLIKGKSCIQALSAALEIGYRHIDTAQIYENESEIGEALSTSNIARKDIFLVTKVWRDSLRSKALIKSTEESLKKLKTDYVDLLLIHWPNLLAPLKETLSAMRYLQDNRMVRLLGVSNFPVELMKMAQQEVEIVCNQVEYHPFLDQSVLLRSIRGNDMFLTAYSPLARGRVFKNPVIQKMAKKYNKTAGQVVLRWLLDQDNVVAIPKASKPKHVKSNFDVFDFKISSTDRLVLASLRSTKGRLVDPNWAMEWD